jgi:outer membrane protein OmpA-like peptidoglycan-associated protein
MEETARRRRPRAPAKGAAAMTRAFHVRIWRIVVFILVAFAAAILASSARAQHGGGMHGGGGFHGGGNFHGNGNFRGGCCAFRFGFGGFGFGAWPFRPFPYGYGYAPYPYYGYAPYPYSYGYYPSYPAYPPVTVAPPIAPGSYTGPAMPPSGPASFAVYFASGSDRLGTAARNVIARAAAAEAQANAQIAVAGFADATGNRAQNLDLSHRRAESVRAALIAAGVPGHLVALVWHGEEGLQVPTADGVAAAENRRVVIVVGAPPPPVS